MTASPRVGEQTPVNTSHARSAEATRHLLLQTAAEMLFEQPGATGLDTIRLADVVHRAGRTVGSAYQIWGRGQGQDAFRRELTMYVARLAVTDPTATIAWLRSAPEGLTLPHLLEAAADHYERLATAQGESWSIGLSLMAAAPYTVELRTFLVDDFENTIAAYSEVLQSVLDDLGLQMRDGYDLSDLITALNAVVNGFFLRAKLSPEAVFGGDGTDRKNLLLTTVEALIGALTEGKVSP